MHLLRAKSIQMSAALLLFTGLLRKASHVQSAEIGSGASARET